MDLESHPTKSSTQASVEELLALVHSMKEEMTSQRQLLEAKVDRLETELRQVRQATVPTTTLAHPTSRRRLLKGLLAGAAGAAILSATAVNSTPAAQASTTMFDFNGISSGTGLNAASGQTSITANNNSSPSPIPIFKFSNQTTSGTGSDPAALPIGVYAESTTSFGVYGVAVSSSASGVIGINGGSANSVIGTSLSSTFYANETGGVLGASNSAAGVVGLSASGIGVDAISTSTWGVRGLSLNGIGGAFAGGINDSPADLTAGAALRLGLRAINVPPSAGYHRSGEIYMDKFARPYICTAGFTPTGTSVIQPNVSDTIPFPDGPIHPDHPNWRMVPTLIFQTVPPNTPFTIDEELHLRGELWVDTSTGITYICTLNGANNVSNKLDALLTKLGIPTTQKPVFMPVAGNPLHLLPTGDRFVFTLAGAVYPVGGTQGPLIGGTPYTFQIGGMTGKNGTVLPSNLAGVVGNIMVLNPSAGGNIKVLPANVTDFISSVGTINFNYGGAHTTANAFNCRLYNDKLIVYLNAGITGDITLDVFGYYLGS